MKLDKISHALLLGSIALLPWLAWIRPIMLFVLCLIWVKARWINRYGQAFGHLAIAQGVLLFFLVLVVGSWYGDVPPDDLIYYFTRLAFPLIFMILFMPYFVDVQHRRWSEFTVIVSVSLFLLFFDLHHYAGLSFYGLTHYVDAVGPQASGFMAACALCLAIRHIFKEKTLDCAALKIALPCAVFGCGLWAHIYVVEPSIAGVVSASCMVLFGLFSFAPQARRWLYMALWVAGLGVWLWFFEPAHAALLLQGRFMLHVYAVFFDVIQKMPFLGHGTGAVHVWDLTHHKFLPGSTLLDIPLQLGVMGSLAFAYWLFVQWMAPIKHTILSVQSTVLIIGFLSAALFSPVLFDVSGLIYTVLMAGYLAPELSDTADRQHAERLSSVE